jgi:hypothetical protein
MIDDRTQYLSLPLPHKDNLLEDDVLRLREAFSALDEDALAKNGQIAAAKQLAAPPASAAEVEAGIATGKFVSPATLAGATIDVGQIKNLTVWMDYVLPAVNADGTIPVRYEHLEHPAPDRAFTPRVAVISRSPCLYSVSDMEAGGFILRLFRPDGRPGVNVGTYDEAGALQCSADAECGRAGMPHVYAALSLPMNMQQQEKNNE